MMPSVGRALVVGGGIGGLTAGVALRQAGVDVDLIELKPSFSVYGVGIIQPNNTLRALSKIGLAQRCMELGAPFPGWRIHDAHGRPLMDAPNATSAAPDCPPNNGITRPDLQRVLADAAKAHGVSIRLGTTISELRDEGPAVDVLFSDGTANSYDLVIGCEGIYSPLRSRIFPEADPPTFTGQSVWRYNFRRPESVVWGEIHLGPKTKVGLTPLRRDLMYMFIVSAEPDNPWMDPNRLAVEMRARLDGFSGPIAALREQIEDSEGVVYKPMENLLLPAPWHKGRVLIIGDAAHATTPHLAQGAAMAIEDAVLLGELLSTGRTLPDLLDEFMRRRFPRARFVVESSDQIASWELESWRGINNPSARPGELLQEASLALLDPY